MIRDTPPSSAWVLFILTAPASRAADRMRIWRGLKSVGCAVLRDGVYILPATSAGRETLLFWDSENRRAGGKGLVLDVSTSATPAAEDDIEPLFDRSDAYREFIASLQAFSDQLSALDESTANRQLRALVRQFEQIVSIDYFPGTMQDEARELLELTERTTRSHWDADEPHATDRKVLPVEARSYQGRIWATRKNLWVDRIASAWLIHRFIDPKGRFLWLEHPSACPADAVGFDFDGATFSHVGSLVTFEVLLASFALDGDPGLARLAQVVHFLDVGGVPVAEAAGTERILKGLKKSAPDDATLLGKAKPIFDALYLAAADNEPEQ